LWFDRRKKHHITIRLDDYELSIVDDISTQLNIDRSEAIRRALYVYRILYDENLKVKDALIPFPDPDMPLYKALKPIPILAHIIGLELKMMRNKVGVNFGNEGFK